MQRAGMRMGVMFVQPWLQGGCKHLIKLQGVATSQYFVAF